MRALWGTVYFFCLLTAPFLFLKSLAKSNLGMTNFRGVFKYPFQISGAYLNIPFMMELLHIRSSVALHRK